MLVKYYENKWRLFDRLFIEMAYSQKFRKCSIGSHKRNERARILVC